MIPHEGQKARPFVLSISQRNNKLQHFSNYLNLFYRVNWEYQRLVFARVVNGSLLQYSSTPNHKGWEAAIEGAQYVAPSTFHQFYSSARNTQKALVSDVDNVPWLFMDIDWHDSRKPDAACGDLLEACMELGLPPTMVNNTPRGLHVFWALKAPIYIAWEQAPGTGIWRPRPGAMKALAWWRSCSYTLCRALYNFGLPVDPVVAGQPARLMRIPTPETVLWSAEQYRYDLQAFEDRLEGYKLQTRRSNILGREVTTLTSALEGLQGAKQGQRNEMCWKLSIVALDQTEGHPEAAWRMVSEWARRCSPPYSQREAHNTFKSVARHYEDRRFYVTRKASLGMTREGNAKRVAQIKQSRALEAILEAADKLIAEGINPIENKTRLAQIAGVSRRSILRHIEDITLTKIT